MIDCTIVTAILDTSLEAMDEVLSKANSFLPDILGRHRAQAIILSDDAMSDHETPLHRKEFIETFLSLDIPHAWRMSAEDILRVEQHSFNASVGLVGRGNPSFPSPSTVPGQESALIGDLRSPPTFDGATRFAASESQSGPAVAAATTGMDVSTFHINPLGGNPPPPGMPHPSRRAAPTPPASELGDDSSFLSAQLPPSNLHTSGRGARSSAASDIKIKLANFSGNASTDGAYMDWWKNLQRQ